MKSLKKLLIPLFFLLSFNSNAGLYLGLGIELGGDTIAESSDEEVNFGSGINYTIGYESELNSNDRLRITIGSLTDDISGYDYFSGDIVTFETSATVIELTYLTPSNNNTIGFGVSLHQSSKLKISSSSTSFTDKIDDSVGFFALYEFNLGQGLDVGIRYTLRDYKIYNATYKANSFGLTVSKRF